MVLPLSFEAIEKELNSRFLNKQIDKYYEWIISSQEKSLLLYKIEAIMAFSSKRINAYDVAQMCGVEHDEAAFVLNGLYPIIVCEGDRYFAFHNDVRLFLQNAIIHNSNIKGITESIINRIKQDRELWKYRYDISFNLLVSCKATDEVLKLIDVEYVMDSALYGISFDRILQQFILAHQCQWIILKKYAYIQVQCLFVWHSMQIAYSIMQKNRIILKHKVSTKRLKRKNIV